MRLHFPTSKSFLPLALLAGALWLSPPRAIGATGAAGTAGAEDWKLYRHNGHDYVSLDNIASFYGLSPAAVTFPGMASRGVTPAGNRTGLANGNAEIGLRPGSREVSINGVRQWLSFPATEEEGKLLISRIDLAKTIEPMLRPQRIANLTRVETVILDPGHGGHDLGATNRLGREKEYTLDVCRRVKPLLEARGLRVVLTRARDVFIPLSQRPKLANETPNSIFVSVHFNSGSSRAHGFEIFAITPRGAPSTGNDAVRPRDYREEPGNAVDVPSAALAASVYHSILGHLPRMDRGLKRARFAVIRLATVPSILIEGGFLTNPEEAKAIATPEWRQNLAKSIAAGILGFKGLSELKRPPELMADYRRELKEQTAQQGSMKE